MKRIIFALVLCSAGMTIFAQDVSYYAQDYKRSDGTFQERLAVLEVVQNANFTGIGDFYHDALKFLLLRLSDMRNKNDRDAAEAGARIICRALGAEKYNAAAPDLWQTVLSFDVSRDVNQGLVMQDAFIALGQVGGKQFVPQIVQRLNAFNSQVISDPETRRRFQRGVVGAVSALEALQDPAGFRPVFFVSIGGYDPSIKAIASVALPNIMEDPGEIISEIIRDNSVTPEIKYNALWEMLRTKAPADSKARVAATALNIGWLFSTSAPLQQRHLKELRMSAIDTIRLLGAANNSVYADLERSYSNNFINNVPDYEEIQKTLSALSALKTDEAVQLLLKFLRELHGRRRNGPWGQKERQAFQWIVQNYIGPTKTQSEDVKTLLTTIERTSDYTGTEQSWARTALRELGQ
jgi:hypothetical protein